MRNILGQFSLPVPRLSRSPLLVLAAAALCPFVVSAQSTNVTPKIAAGQYHTVAVRYDGCNRATYLVGVGD